MGTYIYSGLHPRAGTIPILTFFSSLGGKPVVAMKSSITIEGNTLQKAKIKEVKAIMDAFEQFLIPVIHKTDQDYDYALLVENLDNDSVPDKVKNCSSKPGDSFIGVIIDHNPYDDTYTVGCGPKVFTNVSSDFININPRAEFPCVQIQKRLNSCVTYDNVCDGEAEIKKLLDPVAAIIPGESLPSSRLPTKHNKGQWAASVPVIPQAQSTKSSIPKPSITSARSLNKISPLPQTKQASTQEKNLKSTAKPLSSSCTNKFSLQQALKNPIESPQLKAFTGWCSALKTESPLPEAKSSYLKAGEGSRSSLSYECLEENPWAIPDPSEPFPRPGYGGYVSITELLRSDPSQTQTNSTKSLTSSTSYASSASSKSINPQTQSRISKRSQLTPSTSATTSSHLPQGPHNLRNQLTSPSAASTTEYETGIQAAASSQMSLDDFESLKPTLPPHEKRNKLIQNLMTVTI